MHFEHFRGLSRPYFVAAAAFPSGRSAEWDTDAFCEIPARWTSNNFFPRGALKTTFVSHQSYTLTLQTIHRSQSVWWQWSFLFLFLLRYRYLMLHYDTSGPESSTSAIPPTPIKFQNPTFGQNTLLAFFTLKNSSFELLFLTRPTRNETTFLSDVHFRI